MFTIHVELSKAELSRKKGLAAAGLHHPGTHDCLSQLLLTNLIAICPNQLEELDVCGRNPFTRYMKLQRGRNRTT